jgi:hypothetical protein
MKIFCCYTPAHAVLLEEHFKPSLPADFDLVAYPIAASGPGDFLSPEFLECIRKKIDLVIGSLKENSGEIILWSDIDIVFLRTSAEELRKEFQKAGKLILFQRETPASLEVNTGFMLCLASDETIRFFETLRSRLLAASHRNEQGIANDLLSEGYSIPWGHLPDDYYARTHGWPPPSSIRIYHANYTLGTDGIGQKIRQFRQLKVMDNCGVLGKIYVGIEIILGRMLEKL